MEKVLLRCPKCGQIFKIEELRLINDDIVMITDLQGIIKVELSSLKTTCICCNNSFHLKDNDMISTTDWIADAIFRVRG